MDLRILARLSGPATLASGQNAVEKASFQSGLGDFSDTGRTQSVGLALVGVR